MTFIPNWEEFEKSAEMLYLRDPMNTRYSVKYSHSKGIFLVKITDNKKASMITDLILSHFIRYLFSYVSYKYCLSVNSVTCFPGTPIVLSFPLYVTDYLTLRLSLSS